MVETFVEDDDFAGDLNSTLFNKHNMYFNFIS
jgi:hypothetical protein